MKISCWHIIPFGTVNVNKPFKLYFVFVASFIAVTVSFDQRQIALNSISKKKKQ